ncbi:MAG: thioredoxin family protein [Desulfobulbaceae bacterium]|nr:thioredoxin family protein [Desulfobulbaceae bacterium]
MRFLLPALLCSLVLSGCTTASVATRQQIQPGERIYIDYTCRTASGELAATSRKETAEDKTLAHSPLFAALNNYLPANELVPDPQQLPPLTPTMCFEEMLELLLARQAAGAPIKTPQTLTVEGELIPGLSSGDRYLSMNRSFQKKRRVTIPIHKFEESFKSSPLIGKTIATTEPGMSVTVEAIDGDKVNLRYSAEPGAAFPSPFGPGIITQTEDSFDIKTDAKENTILRSGSMIGKITGVDENSFVVDYGHSTAFTPLTCEVVFQPLNGTAGLSWLDNLDQAKEESRRTGKPLMVHFHDQWNSANRTLLATILPDPRVVAAADGYVRVRMNTLDRITMLRDYRVATIPAILIFDSQGNELQRFIGVPKVDEFVDGLEKILKDPVPAAQ